MNKLRCFLMAIALVATLIGSSLQGLAPLAPLAHAASSQHATAAFVAGKLTKAVRVRPDPPCGPAWDC